MNNTLSTTFKVSLLYLITCAWVNTILYFSLDNLNTIFFLSTNILFALFYVFIYKKIQSYEKEISKLKHKTQKLTNTKNHFLRNIMHEFNTPITKGKLIADTLEDGRKKEILQKTFYRLQYLLTEFSKVEQLNLGDIKLNKKEFYALDLIDQSLDVLQIDENKVDINSSKLFINVDFELFSISLKNLIDNAIKYNNTDKIKIIIKNDYIKIKNTGTAFEKPYDEYIKPFNREYESVQKGLGLGLYISNEIIKAHAYKLHYSYVKNHHIFKIDFK